MNAPSWLWLSGRVLCSRPLKGLNNSLWGSFVCPWKAGTAQGVVDIQRWSRYRGEMRAEADCCRCFTPEKAPKQQSVFDNDLSIHRCGWQSTVKVLGEQFLLSLLSCKDCLFDLHVLPRQSSWRHVLHQPRIHLTRPWICRLARKTFAFNSWDSPRIPVNPLSDKKHWVLIDLQRERY